MRILLFTAAFPGRTDPARVPALASLARELSRRHDVRVLAPRVHAGDPALERMGELLVRRFDIGAPGRTLKGMGPRPPVRVLARYALFALLAVGRSGSWADVVYAHWAVPAGFLAALSSVLFEAPVALHLHGSDIHLYARESRFYRALASVAIGRARCVLAASADLARAARGLGARDVRVVPLGVDTSVFKPGPARRLDGARTALFLGDVTEQKGTHRFVDAVLALPPHWSGTALGDGPLRAALAERARGRVRFLGARPHHEVPAHLAGADVLVLPSRGEGTPVAILEALACGVPVVATRTGGVPEVVADGRSGALIPEDAAPLEIARAVERAVLLGRLDPPRGISTEDRAREVEALLEPIARRRSLEGRGTAGAPRRRESRRGETPMPRAREA